MNQLTLPYHNQQSAWQTIQESLPEKRRIVFECILAHPEGITANRICELTGLPINTVSGRLTELSGLNTVKNQWADPNDPKRKLIVPCGSEICHETGCIICCGCVIFILPSFSEAG